MAFDNYDTILCNDIHQIKEIEHREKLNHLNKKKLIKAGYFYFDYLKKKIVDHKNNDEILVAPTWNKNKLNFINEDFEKILISLLNKDYKVSLDHILKRSRDLQT